jgi:hypothetical protein
MTDDINLNDWYDAAQAAERLSRNSGREIASDYVRSLARYGKIRSVKVSSRATLYLKEDVDRYIVEGRGVKSARAKRQSAKPKPVRKQTKHAA